MSRASAPTRADAKVGLEMLRWMTLARRLAERIERDPALLPREARTPSRAADPSRASDPGDRDAVTVDSMSIGYGLEAISVGACTNARSTDLVAPAPGDLGAFLLRGVPPERILAHYAGRASEPSSGRDGGGRIGDLALGLIAPVTRAASSVAVAAGVALAMKREARSRIVLCLFDERAAWRGDWHEGMNFAAVRGLPVVYVGVSAAGEGEDVEARRALGAPGSHRSASSRLRLTDRMVAYGIPVATVDGGDALDVREAVAEAAARARMGDGPSLVEARVEARPADRDPLARLASVLVRAGHATEDDLVGIEFTVGRILDEAFAKLAGTSFPAGAECLRDVTHGSEGRSWR